ncbi:MAG: hypothetical protein U0325_10965 [Polyangiales bacterium]
MTRDELQRRVDALKQERDAVFARVSWWENHRAGALVPLAVGAFGAGYGVGYGAHLAFGAPYQLGYLGGVAGMFLAGRLVERFTNPSQLPLLDQRVARAEKALRDA